MITTPSSHHALRLTAYSHGGGCGCKLSPAVLEEVLAGSVLAPPDPRLLVGNETRDDAAVWDLGNGQGLISTTDFFLPIVDDPFEFGRIAATNALSDVWAMGGRPIMAIAILGWPLGTLPTEAAARVVDGGRQACRDAGITIAGGHSIDNPEPLFGLAVNGLVDLAHLKRNSSARPGSLLYLTKGLGTGILSTAAKNGTLKDEHLRIAPESMLRLNRIGADLGILAEVGAMTDVTGFGLLGHLLEVCEGSGVDAVLDYAAVPKLAHVDDYIAMGQVPGGTGRNWASYGNRVGLSPDDPRRLILADAQTSGGLLVAVDPAGAPRVEDMLAAAGLNPRPIGRLVDRQNGPIRITLT